MRVLIILHGDPRWIKSKSSYPNFLNFLLDDNNIIMNAKNKNFITSIDLIWSIPDSIEDDKKDIILGINKFLIPYTNKFNKSTIKCRISSKFRFDNTFTNVLKYGYTNYSKIIVTRPDINLYDVNTNFDWQDKFTGYNSFWYKNSEYGKLFIPSSEIDIEDSFVDGEMTVDMLTNKRSYEWIVGNNTSIKAIHDFIVTINKNLYNNTYNNVYFNIGETFWSNILTLYVYTIGNVYMAPVYTMIGR